MKKMITLRLTKREAERLVDDCLDLKDGCEVYIGYSDCKDLRNIYKSIHNKLILCLYGKDLNGKEDNSEKSILRKY